MSICRGIDEIQDRYLGQAAGNRYREVDIGALVGDMLAQIEQNWLVSPRNLGGLRPSRENWRLEKRPHLASHNASPEKTLEKAIARYDGWYNQIPTASGLFNQHSDKLRNIDLVHQIAPAGFEFVELKVGSNTPIYAAMESLIYAALYFFALRNYTEAELASKVLLQAGSIRWLVLAPSSYFDNDTGFVELGSRVSDGLRSMAGSLGVRCEMEFGYQAFPEAFVWPCDDMRLSQAMGQLVSLPKP